MHSMFQSKPGKEKEVADFLHSAVPLVNADAGTISWFAIQERPTRFAIFDTFDDDAGRNAHLNGKVAAALMEKPSRYWPDVRLVSAMRAEADIDPGALASDL
jgi:quinol monooxygenase YgiN